MGEQVVFLCPFPKHSKVILEIPDHSEVATGALLFQISRVGLAMKPGQTLNLGVQACPPGANA